MTAPLRFSSEYSDCNCACVAAPITAAAEFVAVVLSAVDLSALDGVAADGRGFGARPIVRSRVAETGAEPAAASEDDVCAESCRAFSSLQS